MSHTFEVCPVCGKKGWFIASSEYDRENALHTCRYCAAFEFIGSTGKRLISQANSVTAAAPQLLAALKNIMTAYSKLLAVGEPNLDPVWLDAKMAVDRAEGRAL